MSPVSPKIASPGFLAQVAVTTSYFGDLAVTACLAFTEVAGLLSSWMFSVGTETAGRRPGREPVGRLLR
jgi:hypothetical protein